MTATRLRSMVPGDLTKVLALELELFPDDPWTAEMFAEEVVMPPGSRLYLVAEAAVTEGGTEEMAGYAGMMFVPGGPGGPRGGGGPQGGGGPRGGGVPRGGGGGGQADVLTIAVAPRCWGRGIGSALLAALVQAARDHDCTEVFLEVREDNTRARGLYLRRGFEEIGVRRGYYQPSGVNAIVMRKDLLR